MNNSVLNGDPTKEASAQAKSKEKAARESAYDKKAKGSSERLKDLVKLIERLVDSLKAWTAQQLSAQQEAESSSAPEMSDEDKVAILKTKCDYVRSCYRVKILERQKAKDNGPHKLDAEIDELLDSYQRLKFAYEQLERNGR